ncbi:MAG TPA: gamma-glutamyltransferase [Rhodobacteraceae bacterium]|nr:gamma-glutamyltransferase [Amylibacter sp.]MDG1237232.1 gamma-glutamyltransferase [Amylibacter sp.]MDG1998957.1 gamma-glutamyltransferase [Amylibacter sp.]HAD29670.1 gamma-glutamyltransferase [Paracoccaceae bacterium]
MRNFELPGRSPVNAPNGMAATSHPLASQAAIDVLKAGGNAMDGAVAACAVQCVVEPGSTGIGGDSFCLYAPNGTDQVVAFNGSGKAPAAATIDFYEDQGIKKFERSSPHSVTIPGAVDAWSKLLTDHGRMSLSDVLQPAIAYAHDGYPISSRVQYDWTASKPLIAREESTANIFLINGEVPKVGQMHNQRKLADTLQLIAENGRDAFYRGEVAEDIVHYLQEKGGLHTLDDFSNTNGNYVTPITTRYHGHVVHECPPNGQGLFALLLLNIMSGFDPGVDGPITTKRIHQELEACRLAYRARNMYLADPVFSNVPIEEILSVEYASRMRDQINEARATIPPNKVPLTRHEDTVYITVVDKDRNAASFINTLFHGWGSGLTAPKSGVVLQNRGHGFSLTRGHPNCIEGGKRPLHTIIPGMLTKGGKVVMPFGVMGGQYQAFGHLQFLSRFFDYGMDVQEAMDVPRFMVDPFTGEVEIETAVPQFIRDELATKGHQIVKPQKPIGGSQAIWIDWEQGVLTGGSDPRKDGCAIGY